MSHMPETKKRKDIHVSVYQVFVSRSWIKNKNTTDKCNKYILFHGFDTRIHADILRVPRLAGARKNTSKNARIIC